MLTQKWQQCLPAPRRASLGTSCPRCPPVPRHVSSSVFPRPGAVAGQSSPPSSPPHTHVLAIDLFEQQHSMEMCTWALDNLVRPGDRVVLCNVVIIPPVAVFTMPDGQLVSSSYVTDALTRNDEIRARMEDAMLAFKDSLGQHTSLDLETSVVADPDVFTAMTGTSDKNAVIRMLNAQVKELDAGANACTLMVASTSHGGLAEFLVGGSVAAGSVRHSVADAVVVYRTAKSRRYSGKTASGTKRTIAIPVDDRAPSMHAVDWAIRHLARDGDVFKLIHIVPSVPFLLPTPTLGLSPATMLLSADIEQEHLSRAKEYIESTFGPVLRQHNIDYEVECLVQITDGSSDGLGKALLERAYDASLLVIGSASHGGLNEFVFGSLANYIDHHASVPVIVVHS